MKYENLTIAVIPARYQSTRFPGKPLVSILGKSLIQRTVENIQKCQQIDHVIVATDDERIAQVVSNLGVDVEMTDSSCQTGTDRIAQVLTKRTGLVQARYIVNVQGDEPCLDGKSISSILLAMEQRNADIGTAITPIFQEEEISNPNIVKCVKRLDGFALYFSRSPLPGAKKMVFSKNDPFFRHIGMYVFRPQSLMRFASLSKTPLETREDLEMLRALEHGMTIITQEIAHASPGVDIPEDIQKVTQWIVNSTTFS